MIFFRVIYEEKDETKHSSTFTAKRECRVHEVMRPVRRTIVLWGDWQLRKKTNPTTALKRLSISSKCLIVDWLNCVNLSSQWSTLDLGTPRRETTRNKSFKMILDWFFNFGAFLDRENRYIKMLSRRFRHVSVLVFAIRNSQVFSFFAGLVTAFIWNSTIERNWKQQSNYG